MANRRIWATLFTFDWFAPMLSTLLVPTITRFYTLSQAARELGYSPSGFRKRYKQLGITPRGQAGDILLFTDSQLEAIGAVKRYSHQVPKQKQPDFPKPVKEAIARYNKGKDALPADRMLFDMYGIGSED